MALLEIKDLSVTYQMKEQKIAAVEHMSLSIEAKSPLGVVGESGSGKSTMAMAILRMLPEGTQVGGQIYLNGKEILSMSQADLQQVRWKEMSVVFQKSMNILSPVHKIGRQLTDMYQVHDTATSRKEIKKRLTELLELVNLPERVLTSYPHELSGGQLQRVSIAASLMHNPPFVILDEATTALDVITQGQILQEIKKLKEVMNVTWLLITHDISVVSSCCEQIAVMYAGRLMEYGSVEQVIHRPAHPYTKGLLGSFPTLHGEKENLKGIPGSMPDLGHKPEGCVFSSRCPYVSEDCRKLAHGLREAEPGHLTACPFELPGEEPLHIQEE